MLQTQKITSRENAKLKYTRRVRDGREADAIFVEGVRLCEEALRSKICVKDCIVSSKALKTERIKVIAAAVITNGLRIHEVSDDLFHSIADTENPQGVLLICERPETNKKNFERNFQLSSEKIPVVVFLEEANNPANLGAILRTAEAAGAVGVIVSKNSADPFSPKALRASMGSAFRMPVWAGADFGEAIEWSRKREFIPTAADIDGDVAYTKIDWTKPRLLALGSEAHGLSENLKEKIADLIKIPTNSEVESLNLAVSAGVILFEAKRHVSAP